VPAANVEMALSSSEPNEAPPAELPRASLILRFAMIGVVIAGLAGLFAYAGGWFTPNALSPASMIDLARFFAGDPPSA
jgi:hypothetical protein